MGCRTPSTSGKRTSPSSSGAGCRRPCRTARPRRARTTAGSTVPSSSTGTLSAPSALAAIGASAPRMAGLPSASRIAQPVSGPSSGRRTCAMMCGTTSPSRAPGPRATWPSTSMAPGKRCSQRGPPAMCMSRPIARPARGTGISPSVARSTRSTGPQGSGLAGWMNSGSAPACATRARATPSRLPTSPLTGIRSGSTTSTKARAPPSATTAATRITATSTSGAREAKGRRGKRMAGPNGRPRAAAASVRVLVRPYRLRRR